MVRITSENTGRNTSCRVGGWWSHDTRWWLLFTRILTLITPCPLPSWAAVTGPSDVVAGGVVQTVTYLATAVAICPCRALWEGSESPVQPWESGARLSLTVWPWVSGGHPSQGSLFRQTCTTQSVRELASIHGAIHRPGDTGLETEPLITAPDTFSFYVPTSWMSRHRACGIPMELTKDNLRWLHQTKLWDGRGPD